MADRYIDRWVKCIDLQLIGLMVMVLELDGLRSGSKKSMEMFDKSVLKNIESQYNLTFGA